MILNIKYKFADYPNIFLTNKEEMWQKPFESNNRYYNFRLIKPKYHQGQIKYRINGKWISKKKLNESAYLVKEQIDNEQLPEKYKPF
jgi:hypothetical protein